MNKIGPRIEPCDTPFSSAGLKKLSKKFVSVNSQKSSFLNPNCKRKNKPFILNNRPFLTQPKIQRIT